MARNTGARKVITALFALRGGFEVLTLSGDLVLNEFSAQVLRIDPGGAARAVTLPAGEEGDWFCIVNVGESAEDLTVNTSLVTVTPGDCAVVAHINGAWTLMLLNAGGVS